MVLMITKYNIYCSQVTLIAIIADTHDHEEKIKTWRKSI